MKTITVKLHDREAKRMEQFLKKKNYLSKSEFIRHLIMEKLERNRKEKAGWLILAERSMNKMWNNKKDEEVWKKYL